jgi:hypothetical protein
MVLPGQAKWPGNCCHITVDSIKNFPCAFSGVRPPCVLDSSQCKEKAASSANRKLPFPCNFMLDTSKAAGTDSAVFRPIHLNPFLKKAHEDGLRLLEERSLQKEGWEKLQAKYPCPPPPIQDREPDPKPVIETHPSLPAPVRRAYVSRKTIEITGLRMRPVDKKISTTHQMAAGEPAPCAQLRLKKGDEHHA